MRDEVRWERLFPDELEARFADSPVVYFAYGLCEPHGPQNALGLDALKAHAVCVRTAREHGGIVAPPYWWHVHEVGVYASFLAREVGNVERSWLTAVPPWHHFKSVCYHIRQADQLGFKAAILLTGHYGPNWHDLKSICEWVQPRCGVRLYALPDFEANQPGFDGSSGDHAGKVETSLLWALEPDCVDVSRFPDGPERPMAMGANAREADRRIGERMVADQVAWLGRKARELLDAYDTRNPAHSFTTFEDVENFWESDVRPRLGELQSMTERWDDVGYGELDPSSKWYPNYRTKDRYRL